MLRTAETDLSPEAARTWAHTVAVSGGMALVSDDLALLDDRARSLLDDAVAITRSAGELTLSWFDRADLLVAT